MQTPPIDPPVSDTAPSAGVLTSYDEQHLVTYLRLLDADAEGADWREVALIVLHIDPAREPERARRAWDSHLARARWMTESGYRHLLRGARHTSRDPASLAATATRVAPPGRTEPPPSLLSSPRVD